MYLNTRPWRTYLTSLDFRHLLGWNFSLAYRPLIGENDRSRQHCVSLMSTQTSWHNSQGFTNIHYSFFTSMLGWYNIHRTLYCNYFSKHRYVHLWVAKITLSFEKIFLWHFGDLISNQAMYRRKLKKIRTNVHDRQWILESTAVLSWSLVIPNMLYLGFLTLSFYKQTCFIYGFNPKGLGSNTSL